MRGLRRFKDLFICSQTTRDIVLMKKLKTAPPHLSRKPIPPPPLGTFKKAKHKSLIRLKNNVSTLFHNFFVKCFCQHAFTTASWLSDNLGYHLLSIVCHNSHVELYSLIQERKP